MPNYHTKLQTRTLTPDDMAILKKVNNPNVFVLHDDCINTEKHYPNIRGYVDDFMSGYIDAKKISKAFK